jgi:3-methyladenine DNA glycosylase AlkC
LTQNKKRFLSSTCLKIKLPWNHFSVEILL